MGAKRFGLWALTVVIAAATARADVPSDLAAFDRAIAAGETNEAAAAYGRIFEARLPKDGKPSVDSTLDALAGRILLDAGTVFEARPFLALDPTGDIGNADERRLAHALATFLAGDLDASERLFVIAAAHAETPEQKARAIVGQAEVTLLIRPTDTASVLARLPETHDPSIAWRSAFIAAQVALVLQDLPAARAAADRASLLANFAGVRDFAPVQTLQLQAAVAVAEGNVHRVAALLSAVPSSDELASSLGRIVADRAPVCGMEGVVEGDFVTLGIFTQGEAPVAIATPVGASRSAIVPVFMRSIAGVWSSERSVRVAIGPLMTVRCRHNAPSQFNDDASKKFIADAMARNHLRPRMMSLEFFLEDDPLTQSAIVFDRIEAIAGKESPILSPLLTELAELTEQRQQTVGDVPRTRASDYRDRALAQIDKIEDLHILAKPASLRTPAPPDLSTMIGWIATLPPELGYGLFLEFNAQENVPPPIKLQLAEIVAKKWPMDNTRVAQSLTTQRISMMRANGDGAGAEALARLRKRDLDVCGNRAVVPALTEAGIQGRDYPLDAVVSEISGVTIAELDIDQAGKIRSYREVIAAPPMIFSDALRKAAGAILFGPGPAKAGLQCRALQQNIRWRLPSGSDVVIPMLGMPTL